MSADRLTQFQVGDIVRGTGADISGCLLEIVEIRRSTRDSDLPAQSFKILELGVKDWHRGNHYDWQVGRTFFRGCDWTSYLKLEHRGPRDGNRWRVVFDDGKSLVVFVPEGDIPDEVRPVFGRKVVVELQTDSLIRVTRDSDNRRITCLRID